MVTAIHRAAPASASAAAAASSTAVRVRSRDLGPVSLAARASIAAAPASTRAWRAAASRGKYSEILWRACRWPAWLSRHAGAGVLVKGLAGLRWWRGWLCPGAEVFGVGGPGQEPFKAGA